MTGQLFGDRYQVGDTLGFGGMSEVHRGRDLRLGRDVAIKVLRADLARDPSFQARFRREAQNAASLNHPAIVAVYDTGETAGETGTIPYIVMEFVDGETLRDLLKREGPLDPKRAMEIVADVCAALDFSHRHGIVHRDIKPANVMLTRAGAVKVMDFGIARAVADGQSAMTATANVIGTAQYLSPEQARGESVDARSDVYSTGCVLFELLTCAPPFVGDSPVAVAYQHVREDPKPPSATRPGLPRELDAIVLKALNKNPLNRYQTAAEMRSDLVRALSGQAVQAPRVMDDAERTEIMGPGGNPPRNPGAIAAAGTPPILAPPQRIMPDQQWQDPQQSSRRKKIWGYVGIGAICLALLAGAIALTIKFTSAPPPPPEVPVPNLANQTQEQAATLLTAVNLKLAANPERVASTDALKDKVVYQNPSNGTPLAQGGSVTVKIGAGVTEVQVPKVTDLPEGEAQKQLQALNLQMTSKPVASATVPQGIVISQDPKPGLMVKPGSAVTVQVSSGPNLVVIPDGLVGRSLPDATKILINAKLKVVSRTQVSDKPKDQVLAMEGGKAGAKVVEGTPITLVVSDQSQFIVPDVTKMSPLQALQRLQKSGWKGDQNTLNQGQQDSSNRAEWGQVVYQNPAANSSSSINAQISINIGVQPNIFVPALTGTESDARAQLQQAGFQGTINIVTVPNPPPGLGDTVQGQSVPSGSPLAQFDGQIAISIWAPNPPPTPTPPPTTKMPPTTTPTPPPSAVTTPATKPVATPVTPPPAGTATSKSPGSGPAPGPGG